MFDDWFDQNPIEQRADIADHIRKNLSSEHRTFREASSTRRQGMLEATGSNQLDVEGNKSRAGAAASDLEEFDHRINAAGHPIALPPIPSPKGCSMSPNNEPASSPKPSGTSGNTSPETDQENNSLTPEAKDRVIESFAQMLRDGVIQSNEFTVTPQPPPAGPASSAGSRPHARE